MCSCFLLGTKPKQIAVVLFEYRPEQPDELELNEGEEVEVVKMVSCPLIRMINRCIYMCVILLNCSKYCKKWHF